MTILNRIMWTLLVSCPQLHSPQQTACLSLWCAMHWRHLLASLCRWHGFGVLMMGSCCIAKFYTWAACRQCWSGSRLGATL